MAKDKISTFDRFYFIGEIKPRDEGYKMVETAKSKIHTLRFDMKCGNNYHTLELVAFEPNDISSPIYYFTSDGKSEKVEYNRRHNIDTEKLSYSHPKVVDLVSSQRYIHDIDFLNYIRNLISSEQYKNNKYKIDGNFKRERYLKNGKMTDLVKFIPNLIEVVDPTTEPKSEASITMYLGEDCFKRLGDDNTAILNGKSVQKVWNRNTRQNEYESYDTNIEVDLGISPDLAFEKLKERYQGGTDTFRKIGIYCNLLNGSQEVEFTEDMLSDDEKYNIELGIDTFEDLKRAKGTGRGEFVRSTVRIRELRGYADGSQETAITPDDIDTVKIESVSSVMGSDTPSDFNSANNDEDLPF
jgi:hypothetical protein